MPELILILTPLQETVSISLPQAKTVFRLLFLTIHGYVSMFANNSLEYNEAEIARDLTAAFWEMMHTRFS